MDEYGSFEDNSALDTAGSDHIIRVRGLPWSCTEQNLKSFFSDCAEGILKVHFTCSKEGRPNGEAYIEFSKSGYVLIAKKKNKEYLGQRYIEVFEATKPEMEYVLRRNGKPSQTCASDAVVRLRGLPFDAMEDEIHKFFDGLAVAQNGVFMTKDKTGRASGEAFVKFQTAEDATAAIQKHMERLGRRYIEVFPSSEEEVKRSMRSPRPEPYPTKNPFRGGRGGGSRGFDHRGGGGRGGRGGRGGSSGGYGYGEYDFGSAAMGYGDGGGGGGWGNFASDGDWNSGGGGFGGRPAPLFDSQSTWFDKGPRRTGPQSRGPGHFVEMRGLPWSATEQDISQFFSPLRLKNIFITRDAQDRPSGEAVAEFLTHDDAADAMKKDKEVIGTRYIELFLNSSKKPAQV